MEAHPAITRRGRTLSDRRPGRKIPLKELTKKIIHLETQIKLLSSEITEIC